MSILGGAIGAGVIMAAIGHEMSLAREADRINTERVSGEAAARIQERSAREEGLRDMRGITDANMQSRMMRRGIVGTVPGRAAKAMYMQELARSGRY